MERRCPHSARKMIMHTQITLSNKRDEITATLLQLEAAFMMT
jgi:hypothetical protein